MKAVILLGILILAACTAPTETAQPELTPEPVEEIPSCSDTDGGIDLTIKGTVTTEADSFTDSCTDAKKVKEYYCDAGLVKEAIRACAGSCQEGVCKEIQPAKVGGCTDSDGGVILDVYGEVTDENNNVFEDFCEPGRLQEAVCDSFGFGKHKQISCDVCEEGVCLQVETTSADLCTDSDGGPIIETKGTATGQNGVSFTDQCGSGDWIEEAVCDSFGFAKHKVLNCDVCEDGVCLTEELPKQDTGCTDTDLGARYDTKGTVTDSAGREGTDYCKYSTALIEYVCDSYGFIKEKTINCDCVEGACLPE